MVKQERTPAELENDRKVVVMQLREWAAVLMQTYVKQSDLRALSAAMRVLADEIEQGE